METSHSARARYILLGLAFAVPTVAILAVAFFALFPVSTEHTGPRLPRAESGRTGPQTPPRGEVGGEK